LGQDSGIRKLYCIYLLVKLFAESLGTSNFGGKSLAQQFSPGKFCHKIVESISVILFICW